MSDRDPTPQSADQSDEDHSEEDIPTLPPGGAIDDQADRSVASQDLPTIAPQSSQAKVSQSRVSTDVSPQGAAANFPRLEGYEFLSELGRGGMGVVYKARDTKLDRTVAIKMVLGGQFASPQEIERFRIEGEAAARLDHPGIVPIYEIDQADGNHFFSMKFIDGSSLSDCRESFQNDPKSSAELLIKIARAVQHAHQRGVLHRDLKPANILLDRDGNPSVTDLGLAKRIDGESELTQTGLIMGTPGYMAPEQAAGLKDITTAADVFSLGSILFWLLTGRAPFVGDNALQTVMQTIECDTPSIRSLNETVDNDLDLICRKAMEKDPLLRYSSAAALADDLQAWLDGEFISVKAPTALSIASVWVKKNLRPVVGAGLSGSICGFAIGVIGFVAQMRQFASEEIRVQELGDQVNTWARHFTSLADLSDGWAWIQYLMVPAIALSAVTCVLIVRPKTREANIVAGVTTGLVAGVIAFVVGLGWNQSSRVSVDNGLQDIQMLASSFWLETDQERELSKQAMMLRYPGLESIEKTDRPTRLREKIIHEQTAGLIPGTWSAVAATLFMATLPLIATTIVSGMLWQQGKRSGEWIGFTWERGAYCLVFFIILQQAFMADVPAHLGINVVCLLAIGTCLMLALREFYLPLRICLIPIPFLCVFWIGADIKKMNGAARNAGYSLTKDDFQTQLIQCDRRLEKSDASFMRFQAAVGWLYLDDRSAYQKHRAFALNHFEGAFEPNSASRLAKLGFLDPDGLNQEQMQFLDSLSEFACGFDSNQNIRWFYSTRALLDLRRGKEESALKWNQKCRVDEDVSGKLKASLGYRHAISHAVDALALFKLGRIDDSNKSLKMGKTIAEQTRQVNLQDARDDTWYNWLTFKILEREAESKL